MVTQELSLLKSAVSEINQLRNQNKVMSARLEMFDNVMLLFRTNTDRGGMCSSPDIVWEIESYFKKQEEKAEKLHL